MNEQELRDYAVRGLTARLTELDEERARILVLLERWDGAPALNLRRKTRSPLQVATPRLPVADSPVPVPGARTPIASRAVPRRSERGDSPGAQVPITHDASAPITAPEPEVARVLPRRNRLQARPVAAEQAPALPPMPRLVKARAS